MRVSTRRQLAAGVLTSVAALVLLASAPVSEADPTITLTPEVTAGGLGGRSAVNVTLHVAGTEYGGFPPPVTEVALKLPAGTTIGVGDHATCAKQVLEQTGPNGCAIGSSAGPHGNALTIVSFGSERIEETATVESFFAPGGGLNFFIDGHTPTSLEIIISATITGNLVTLSVPLVSTVPGGPYASIEELLLRLGESPAEETASHLQSGVTLTSECPTSKFSWAATVTFDREGAGPPKPLAEETTAETGCPAISPEELLRRQVREEEAAAKKKAEETAAKQAEEALDKTILAALDKAIAPTGRSARLAALLKTGRFTRSFASPAAGTLVIDWYTIPKSTHARKHAKPLLIATGKAIFAAAGTKHIIIKLTRKGTQLIKNAKSIKLTAKGTFTPTGKPAVTALRTFTLRR